MKNFFIEVFSISASFCQFWYLNGHKAEVISLIFVDKFVDIFVQNVISLIRCQSLKVWHIFKTCIINVSQSLWFITGELYESSMVQYKKWNVAKSNMWLQFKIEIENFLSCVLTSFSEYLFFFNHKSPLTYNWFLPLSFLITCYSNHVNKQIPVSKL